MWRNPQFPSDLVTFTGDRMKLIECWEENTFLFPIGKR